MTQYYINNYFCRNLTQDDFNEILLNGDYNRYYNSYELERINSMLDKRDINITEFLKKCDLPFYQFIFSSPFIKDNSSYINVKIVSGVNCDIIADFDVKQYKNGNVKDKKGFYWHFLIKDVKNEIFLQYLKYFNAVSDNKVYTHRAIYSLSFYENLKDKEIDHINCKSSDNTVFNLQALDKETHTLKHQDELNHANTRRFAEGLKPLKTNNSLEFFKKQELKNKIITLDDFKKAKPPDDEFITADELPF